MQDLNCSMGNTQTHTEHTWWIGIFFQDDQDLWVFPTRVRPGAAASAPVLYSDPLPNSLNSKSGVGMVMSIDSAYSDIFITAPCKLVMLNSIICLYMSPTMDLGNPNYLNCSQVCILNWNWMNASRYHRSSWCLWPDSENITICTAIYLRKGMSSM